ncbi:MAG: hypothetical protein CMH30_09305 [Micavibrio sp.]|nr:hypothetical protein [Micavibrio sp.]|tara:strand:- start:263 stop:556 length:294 start_codon:yes stop_codon:yes gene_type:complete
MNNFFKEKLKNRLMYCLNWKKDTELYLKYKNLTDTVNRKYYEKKPILKLFLNIYFLPINVLKFLHLLRISRDLEKNNIEISYIYNQLDKEENNYEKE